jgi:thioesterase domain-containing protein
MLDTPLPEFPGFTVRDKFEMLFHGVQRSGFDYLRQKWRNKVAWRKQQRAPGVDHSADTAKGAQFQSTRIGDAFIRALRAYIVKPVDAQISLFRPKLDVRYRLSNGRLLSRDRSPLHPDNGWGPYARGVDVCEVPGNHDSMVLEPNVRVLVSAMRRSIGQAFQKRSR